MTTEGKKLILIVDDSPANLRVAHEILKGLYKIRVATSGSMALETVKLSPPPDLILLDVLMPEMDGYEVCARLKADLLTRDIPVIFLTGMTHGEDETRGFAAGAVDYIHKPFSPPVLLARVHTHLVLQKERQQLIETVLGTLVSGDAPGRGFNPEIAASLVVQLKILLVANDGNATDTVEQVADALAGGVNANVIAALRKSVQEFDFTDALAKLDEIAKACNLSMDEPHVSVSQRSGD
jgi:CheY-like chemotaxis protein